MIQRENLWGRYRPCEGFVLEVLEDLPGKDGGIKLTYKLLHHQPEPNIVVAGTVDSWGREGLPSHISGMVHTYLRSGPTQSLLAFQRGLIRIADEYCP